MEFRILGPIEAWRDGLPLPLGGPKQRALLALLLLHHNEVVSRDHLIDWIWGERAPAGAAHSLDDSVSRLRRLLGDGRISRQPPGYVLRVEPGELDLDSFEQLVAEGRTLLARGDAEPAGAAFRAALALWRGPAIGDLRYEQFAAVEAGRLEDLHLSAHEYRFEADLTHGLGPELVRELERLVHEHPFRERLVGQLMLALYRAGRQTDALEVLRTSKHRLAEELGLAPGPQLQELESQILRHDPALRGRRPLMQRARSRKTALIVAAAAVTASAAVGIAVLETSGTPAATVSAASNQLLGIQTAAGHVRATVALNSTPSALADDGSSLWLADSDQNTVLRVDPRTQAIVDRIPVGGEPGALIIGGGSLWVASTSGRRVSRIDPQTGTITQSVQIGVSPTALAFGDSGLWIADPGDKSLIRLDPATASVDLTVSFPSRPTSVVVGAGGIWVASYDAGTVTKLDPGTGQLLATVTVGHGPAALATGAGSVWVANSLDGTITRIDPTTVSVQATIPTGSGPIALAYADRLLWVGNEFSRTVTRIDPNRDSVVGRSSVGGRPVTLTGAAGTVWVGTAPFTQHRGGTMTLLGTAPFPSDPALNYAIGPFQADGLARDGLVTQNHTGSPAGLDLVPDLAISLPTQTKDGTTYTFQIRQGIRYSDGSQLRAEDFRRAIERLFRVGSPATGLFSGIRGAGACTPNHCDLSRGIVTDNTTRTIAFHLTAPDSDFLFKLSVGGFSTPIPRGTPFRTGIAPIPGTGPYRVAHADQHEILYVRNRYFHEWSHAAQPDGNPDQILWRFGLPPAAEVRAVEQGHADWTPDGIPPALVYEAKTRFAAQLHVNPGAETDFMQFNTQLPPFNDVRVRQALNLAINRGFVVRLYGGRDHAIPTCQILPPGIPGYQRYCPYTRDPHPGAPWTAPDLARAQHLVAASGTRGTKVTVLGLTDEGSVQITRYIASVLRQLGYPTNVQTLTHAQLEAGGQTALARIQIVGPTGWTADYPSAYDFFEPWLSCAGTMDHSYFCHPNLDRQVLEAAALETSDPQRANTRWAYIDRAYVEQAAWVPLVTVRQIDLVSARVRNYQHNPTLGLIADQVWIQ